MKEAVQTSLKLLDSNMDQTVDIRQENTMTKRTFTDEQVKAARAANYHSRSSFYREHDKEEMLSLFELLHDHATIDDLGAINKTKLTDAIQAQAETILDTHNTEASLESATRAMDEWSQKVFDHIVKLEEEFTAAGQEIADKPSFHSTTWKIESLLSKHVEIRVNSQVRNFFFETEDKGVTWTRREAEGGNIATLKSVQQELLDDILSDARNMSNKSSGAMRNVESDLEIEHRTNIYQDLSRMLRRAAEKGLI